MNKRKIYIVLPAYNEELTIGSLLGRIRENMSDFDLENYEVVIVNDGSKDNTTAVIEDLQKQMPITLLHHEVNQGLGATIRDGLFHAAEISGERDIIITMDADDTHTPGLILRMIRMVFEGHDVVIASRYQAGARVVGLSLFRRFISYAASWLFRIIFPTSGVRDFTCGYRAYRADILKKAISKYGSKFIDQEGFQCMVDILLKLRKMNLIFGEVPFVLRYDQKEGESKMKVWKTIKNTLRLMVIRKIEK